MKQPPVLGGREAVDPVTRVLFERPPLDVVPSLSPSLLAVPRRHWIPFPGWAETAGGGTCDG